MQQEFAKSHKKEHHQKSKWNGNDQEPIQSNSMSCQRFKTGKKHTHERARVPRTAHAPGTTLSIKQHNLKTLWYLCTVKTTMVRLFSFPFGHRCLGQNMELDCIGYRGASSSVKYYKWATLWENLFMLYANKRWRLTVISQKKKDLSHDQYAQESEKWWENSGNPLKSIILCFAEMSTFFFFFFFLPRKRPSFFAEISCQSAEIINILASKMLVSF